jgi:hypothetical protein
MRQFDGLRKKLLTPPKLPEAYAKAEKSINGLIDSCMADLRQLRVRHNEHVDKHVSSHRKFEQLRLKLLNGEPLNTGEATGDAVAKMLKEIEEGSSLGNPYSLPSAEVEQRMAEMRQRMADIRMNIKTLWTKPSVTEVEKPLSTVEFRDRTVALSDLAAVSPTVTTVSFVGCRSKEWLQIGQRLETLPQLKTLSAEHCDSEDTLCEGIHGSKWLTNVRMGRRCVTQTTAASPTKESNNCAEYSSWSNCVSAALQRRPTATTTRSLWTSSKQ